MKTIATLLELQFNRKKDMSLLLPAPERGVVEQRLRREVTSNKLSPSAFPVSPKYLVLWDRTTPFPMSARRRQDSSMSSCGLQVEPPLART